MNTQQVKKKKTGKKKVKKEIARVLNKDVKFQRGLILRNPYLNSLLDPWNCRGHKIPDDVLYPSVPFTIISRRTLTINLNGVAGVCYGLLASTGVAARGSLVPVRLLSDAPVNAQTLGMVFGSSATVADLTAGILNLGGPNAIQYEQWQDTQSNAIVPAFEKVRLVSAGLNIVYTGNSFNSNGKMTLAFAPGTYSRSSAGLGYGVNYVAAIPDAVTVPINTLTGGTVLYKPYDPVCLKYTYLGNGSSTQQLYPVVTSADWATLIPQAACGELWACVDGGTPGATLQVTFIANYEAVPTKNTLLFSSADMSAHDPIALSHAMSVVNETASSFGSSTEAQHLISSTGGGPSTTEEMHVHTDAAHQPSMMDSLLGLLDKAPGVIDKGQQIWNKLSPIAESALAMIA